MYVMQSKKLERMVLASDLNPNLSRLFDKLFEEQFGRLRSIEKYDHSFLVLTSNRDGRGVPTQKDDRIIKVSRIE